MASMLVLGTKSYGFKSRYSEMKYWQPSKKLSQYKVLKSKWLLEMYSTQGLILNNGALKINTLNNNIFNKLLPSSFSLKLFFH